jgi:hypothetical protein
MKIDSDPRPQGNRVTLNRVVIQGLDWRRKFTTVDHKIADNVHYVIF